MRAAILAAGRGLRMGGVTPKTLIPIDGHEPLIHYLLSAIRDVGITDVMVVTGFAPAELQAHIDEHSEGLELAYVRNARFASWGNFHSVRVALDQSPGIDLLVVNCDIIVSPDVFRRVLRTHGDLVLAVERKNKLDPEEMRVELRGDSITAIGKGLAMDRSHGESCGVSLIRPQAARHYGDVANRLEWSADTDLYYEDIYASMLGRVEVVAAAVEPGEYAEVDQPDDIPKAARVIEGHSSAWGPRDRTEPG